MAERRYTVMNRTGLHYTERGQSIFGGALRAKVLAEEFHRAEDLKTANAELAVEVEPTMTLTAKLSRVGEIP